MTDDEIIEVVRAHKEGKQIQHRLNENTDGDPADHNWKDVEIGRLWPWNFLQRDYRVKPEPRKPREWTLFDYGDGVTTHPIDGCSYRTIRVREVIE